MKFDDRYPWVRIAWEAFEMTLLKRGDEKYISLVGNRVKIFESKKISWNQGFDLKGGDILISSQMSEYEKAEMLYFLLLDEAKEVERELKSDWLEDWISAHHNKRPSFARYFIMVGRDGFVKPRQKNSPQDYFYLRSRRHQTALELGNFLFESIV